MRVINAVGLHCPKGWDARAEKAKAAAANDLDKINKRSKIWRDLKNALADLSHDKCWYCEVKQERSDNAVDHFRPKIQLYLLQLCKNKSGNGRYGRQGRFFSVIQRGATGEGARAGGA